MVSIPRTYATCGKKQAHISSVSISNTMSKHKEAPPTKVMHALYASFLNSVALIIGSVIGKGFICQKNISTEGGGGGHQLQMSIPLCIFKLGSEPKGPNSILEACYQSK